MATFAVWDDLRERWERSREGDAAGLLLQVPLRGAAENKKTAGTKLKLHSRLGSGTCGVVGGYFPAWSHSPLPFLPVPLGVDEPVHKVLGLHLVQVAGEVAGEGAFRVSLDVGREASGALGFV